MKLKIEKKFLFFWTNFKIVLKPTILFSAIFILLIFVLYNVVKGNVPNNAIVTISDSDIFSSEGGTRGFFSLSSVFQGVIFSWPVVVFSIAISTYFCNILFTKEIVYKKICFWLSLNIKRRNIILVKSLVIQASTIIMFIPGLIFILILSKNAIDSENIKYIFYSSIQLIMVLFSLNFLIIFLTIFLINKQVILMIILTVLAAYISFTMYFSAAYLNQKDTWSIFENLKYFSFESIMPGWFYFYAGDKDFKEVEKIIGNEYTQSISVVYRNIGNFVFYNCILIQPIICISFCCLSIFNFSKKDLNL